MNILKLKSNQIIFNADNIKFVDAGLVSKSQTILIIDGVKISSTTNCKDIKKVINVITEALSKMTGNNNIITIDDISDEPSYTITDNSPVMDECLSDDNSADEVIPSMDTHEKPYEDDTADKVKFIVTRRITPISLDAAGEPIATDVDKAHSVVFSNDEYIANDIAFSYRLHNKCHDIMMEYIKKSYKWTILTDPNFTTPMAKFGFVITHARTKEVVYGYSIVVKYLENGDFKEVYGLSTLSKIINIQIQYSIVPVSIHGKYFSFAGKKSYYYKNDVNIDRDQLCDGGTYESDILHAIDGIINEAFMNKILPNPDDNKNVFMFRFTAVNSESENIIKQYKRIIKYYGDGTHVDLDMQSLKYKE